MGLIGWKIHIFISKTQTTTVRDLIPNVCQLFANLEYWPE